MFSKIKPNEKKASEGSKMAEGHKSPIINGTHRKRDDGGDTRGNPTRRTKERDGQKSVERKEIP